MIHTQSLNELWWRMLWNICHSIYDEVLESMLWWRYDEWCVEELFHRLLNEVWNECWRMLWWRFDEISVTQFVAKDLWKYVMHDVLKVLWKYVMHDVLKVLWKYVMHDVLKVCWRIIPPRFWWMLRSECCEVNDVK